MAARAIDSLWWIGYSAIPTKKHAVTTEHKHGTLSDAKMKLPEFRAKAMSALVVQPLPEKIFVKVNQPAAVNRHIGDFITANV